MAATGVRIPVGTPPIECQIRLNLSAVSSANTAVFPKEWSTRRSNNGIATELA